MNWKIVFIGGIAYYVAMFVVLLRRPATVSIPPDGVLFETYRETAAFWRPELSADPPDMGALMPMWIATGLLGDSVAAGTHSVVIVAGPRRLQRGCRGDRRAFISALGATAARSTCLTPGSPAIVDHHPDRRVPRSASS